MGVGAICLSYLSSDHEACTLKNVRVSIALSYLNPHADVALHVPAATFLRGNIQMTSFYHV